MTMTGSTQFTSLEALLKQGKSQSEGALTVVLGGMSAGKNAVGLAFARAVLAKKGIVAVCQPGDRGSLRTPGELSRRLGPSMGLLGTDDWTSRVVVLQPQRPNAAAGRSGGQGCYWPVIEAGEYILSTAKDLGWHQRMLIIQDYNVLMRSEPEATPGRLRALALAFRMNVVLFVDVTGGDREIAKIAGDLPAVQEQAIVTLFRQLLEEGRLESEEVALIDRQLPELAAAARGPEGADSARAIAAASASRHVRVHAGQIQVVEAAHRLVYVEKVAPNEVAIHTLKSKEGPAGVRRLQLDAGFLAWPPERLLDPQAADRDRELAAGSRPKPDPMTEPEVPRG
jgi:hypothetical protein